MLDIFLRDEIDFFFKEEGLSQAPYYLAELPSEDVACTLNFKSDLVLAGLPYFAGVFKYLLGDRLAQYQKEFLPLNKSEGKQFKKGDQLSGMILPFDVALTGERIALNLLAHASAIATQTATIVAKARDFDIAILDTRKTLPGLRHIEKYAVRVGGGCNHRCHQTDVWMVKDNHKKFFGGVKSAVDFFQNQKSFYRPLVLEVHSLEEFQQGLDCNVKHFLLDNFSHEMLKVAIAKKTEGITFEASGGITSDNLHEYLIKGLDAISMGALTYAARPVDISLKFAPRSGV